jgi:hypothetical protein
MVSPLEKVEQFKKDYVNKTDNELLLLLHRLVPTSEEHIAVEQIIEERRKNQIDAQTVVSKKTNSLTFYILILTIIILIATIGQLILTIVNSL